MPNRKPAAVYVIEKVGWRKGLTALTYLAAWGLASEALGHPVTVAEYSHYWKQSLAKSYKEREAFVLAWPQYEKSPEPLWRLVGPKIVERKRRDVVVTQLSGVTVDV